MIWFQGVDGLEGQLKEDFYKMVDSAVDEKLKKEKIRLTEKLMKQIQSESDTKQSELSKYFFK